MISSYFKGLVVCLISCPVWATKIPITDFCEHLHGQWQGYSTLSERKAQLSKVSALCSPDKQQIVLFVSLSKNKKQNETWWFRQTKDKIFLSFYDGQRETSSRQFTLYKLAEGYSFLADGEVYERPALIKFVFNKTESGWQWLQQVQFLDDDITDYQVIRTIEMEPG